MTNILKYIRTLSTQKIITSPFMPYAILDPVPCINYTEQINEKYIHKTIEVRMPPVYTIKW